MTSVSYRCRWFCCKSPLSTRSLESGYSRPGTPTIIVPQSSTPSGLRRIRPREARSVRVQRRAGRPTYHREPPTLRVFVRIAAILVFRALLPRKQSGSPTATSPYMNSVNSLMSVPQVSSELDGVEPFESCEQARSKPPISCFVSQAIARATLSQMFVRTAIPPQACYPAGNSSRESPVDRSYANPTASSCPAIPHHMVTTAFTLDGFNIVRNLGLVRGIIVRSRSIVGTIGASAADDCGRQHNPAHQSLRTDARARLRPYVAACCGIGRQCGHRHAL